MITIEAIGAICLGTVIGWLIRYFIRRFDKFNPKALSTVASIIVGGAVVRFLQVDKSVWWFYPIGLLLGFIVYALPFGERPEEKIHIKDSESKKPESVKIDEGGDPSKGIVDKNIKSTLKTSEKLCMQGDYEPAESILIQKAKENSSNFEVLKALFYLYLDPKCKLKRNEEIAELMNKRKRYFDDNPEYYRLLAIVYMETRDEMKVKEELGHSTFSTKEKAIEATKKAIELDSNNPHWHRLLGYVYYWFGDIKQAIGITEKSLKMAEDQKAKGEIVNCKNNLAFYYASIEDKEHEGRAKSYAKEANAHDPTSALFLDTFGYVKWKFAKTVRELEEAANILDMAYRREPFDSEYARHLTECLQEKKFREMKDKGEFEL